MFNFHIVLFIPTNSFPLWTFNTKTLIEALERIAIVADQQSNVVKFKLGDGDLALISADAQDIGSANESVPVSYSGEIFNIAEYFDLKILLYSS